MEGNNDGEDTSACDSPGAGAFPESYGGTVAVVPVGRTAPVSRSVGTTTRAMTPPSMSSFSRRRTSIPCRLASRATTYRPIRRVTDTSRSGGSANRSLASVSCWSDMPTPRSVICTASELRRVTTARTLIAVSGSEK